MTNETMERVSKRADDLITAVALNEYRLNLLAFRLTGTTADDLDPDAGPYELRLLGLMYEDVQRLKKLLRALSVAKKGDFFDASARVQGMDHLLK